MKVDDGEPCIVRTNGGEVSAHHVVLATHFPFPDRGLYFARVHAERSYCVAAPLEGEPPEGMFISASSPTRSIRFHPEAGRELLIVGGEGHPVGRGGPTGPRYDRARELRPRAFRLRPGHSPLVGAGQLRGGRRAARRKADAALAAHLGGHRLPQVGACDGRGGRAADHRRDRRP